MIKFSSILWSLDKELYSNKNEYFISYIEIF